MRLIDADKLHYIHKWFEDSGKGEVVVFAKEIDKAPIVNAIPIDFLRDWFGGNYNAFTDLMIRWERK